MKQDNFIRDAIDESLSGVQFTQRDMHRVLRATRSREKVPVRPSARPRRFEFAFAMGLLAIVILPVALLTLRAQSMRTTRINAAPGDPIAAVQQDADPQADRIVSTAAPGYTADESEAIRIARACFESVCDTSIFTFEEYAVSVTLSEAAEYTVTMESIYGNGCRFTAVVSLTSGSVVRHSTPQLATTPTYLSTDSPEVGAWYDRYGPYIITWPQEAQAEFSRRYEGALLRTAAPGELTPAEAVVLAKDAARERLSLPDDASLFGYSLLYAERASQDGTARYVVSVFPSLIEDAPPELLCTVSFNADGSRVVVTTE